MIGIRVLTTAVLMLGVVLLVYGIMSPTTQAVTIAGAVLIAGSIIGRCILEDHWALHSGS